MRREDTIDALAKFMQVDKYHSFHEIVAFDLYADVDERKKLTAILNHCAQTLINILSTVGKYERTRLRNALNHCMDQISKAPISNSNKEFGYTLGYFLAEKVSIDIKVFSEKKEWGYWKVERNEVVMPEIKRKMEGKKKK